jgi:hypothetical protein
MEKTDIAKQLEQLVLIEQNIINRLKTYPTEEKRIEYLYAVMKNTVEYKILEHLDLFMREECPEFIKLFKGYPDSLKLVYKMLDKRLCEVYANRYHSAKTKSL